MKPYRVAALVMLASVVGLMAGAPDAATTAKPYSRFCKASDLVGTWRLVKFSSPYQFKDPQAPFLMPYQMFQFSKDGTMKSAHSGVPFTLM